MFAHRDLDKDMVCSPSIVPAAKNASTNGTGVDLAGFAAAFVIVGFGVVTDGTHTPKLQESDDNSSYSDVAAGDQSGTFAAVTSGSGGSANQEVGYLGTKRYIRVVVTVTGATTGALTTATVVKAYPRTYPQ